MRSAVRAAALAPTALALRFPPRSNPTLPFDTMNRVMRASTSTLRTVSARASPSFARAAVRPAFAASSTVSAVRSLQTSADATSLIGTLPESATEPFKIALHPEYFQTHRCDTPSLEYETTKDGLVEMYRNMVTMRRMEMAADQVSDCPGCC